jgi:large subunit ribosomal protein L10
VPAKEKIEQVDDLSAKLSRSSSVIVADYRGLTVEDANALRAKMCEASVEYRVAKNRLMKRALEKSGFDANDEILAGPSGFAFSFEDPVAPAKVLTAFAEDNENLQIKGGWLGTERLSLKTIAQLASLPSREQLLARMMGSLMSPATKLAMGLKQTVSKVAYALKAVADAKPADA